MERATAGSGQFLTEPDAGQVIDWLLTLPRRVTPAGHPDPPGEVPGMTPAALLARLISRGYIPVSHGPADYPENWLDHDGPAGSIRVVTHPGDGERVEVYGLGPRPAGLTLFDVRLSGSTPEAVTVAMLNAAEAWLAGQRRPHAPPPPPSRAHSRKCTPARAARYWSTAATTERRAPARNGTAATGIRGPGPAAGSPIPLTTLTSCVPVTTSGDRRAGALTAGRGAG